MGEVGGLLYLVEVEIVGGVGEILEWLKLLNLFGVDLGMIEVTSS